MTKEQAVTELNALRRRDPFTPFVIVLQNGRRLIIHRPLQFGIQDWLGVAFDERERIVRFQPAEVVSIEVPTPVS